ncbi:MAG: methyltransferase [Candidatus Micrarchaeota archaeon]|nr:methyltransferase [Candidatus Micrarchaeota archaeon]
MEGVLKKEKGSYLDMGTGSGYLAISYKRTHPEEEVWAADIDPEALQEARRNAQGLDIVFVESDLFSNISRRFEVISFNPPYLPPDGGPPDPETVDNGSFARFVKEVQEYLLPGGRAYVLINDQTPGKDLLQGWELVARKKLFFEELFVYRYIKE